MRNSTWAIAYLLRKTSMTRSEIMGLGIKDFRALLGEVQYQEAIGEYQENQRLAHLLAAIANTIARKTPKTYKAADFLTGKPPRRLGEKNVVQDDKEQLKALAKRFNIKLPGRETKDL